MKDQRSRDELQTSTNLQPLAVSHDALPTTTTHQPLATPLHEPRRANLGRTPARHQHRERRRHGLEHRVGLALAALGDAAAGGAGGGLRGGHLLARRRRASRRYRIVLAALRLAILGLVLLMIAQVTLSLKRTGLPYAAVLIDDSLSMTIVDHYADKTAQGDGRAAARQRPRRRRIEPLESSANAGGRARRRASARNRRRPQAAGLFRHRRAGQPAPGRARHRRGTAIVGPQGRDHAAGRRRARGARRLARRHAGRRRRADRRHQHRRAVAGRRGRARPATRRAALLRRPRQRPPRPRPETLRSDGRRRCVRRRRGELRVQADRRRLRGAKGVDRAAREGQARHAGQHPGEDRSDRAARRSAAAGSPAIPSHEGRPVRVRRRGPAAGRRDSDGEQPPEPRRPGPQGEDPRPAGPSLSELRVPLPAQHAPPRRDDLACTPCCRTPTRNTPSKTPRRCGRFRSAAKICSPTTS